MPCTRPDIQQAHCGRLCDMRQAVPFLAALLLVSCGVLSQGSIGPKGYSNQEFHYQVEVGEDLRLMPPGWKLDNFHYPEPNPLITNSRPPQLEEKNGPDHVRKLHLDTNGDGKANEAIERHIYDLRFDHEEHDGIIFLRTIPANGVEGRKRLSVLMARYVDGIAGSNYELSTVNASTIFQERRHAAVVVSKGDSTLAGRAAFEATIHIANLDQIEVAPSAVEEQVELVILRTPFNYIRGTEVFPVLMVAGYANHPENFTEGLAHFHDFLNRIVIAGERGYETRASVEVAPSPPAE